jgi:hypothetical protein
MDEVFVIPKAKLQEIMQSLERVEKRFSSNDLISEKEAAILLDVTEKTVQNYVSDGTIPTSAYSVGIKNKRFYYKSRLMGLVNG